jgi:hypothetical protein
MEDEEAPRKVGRGRKRQDAPATVDAAQARQVKNRASAERSRQRKLAYTASLEERLAELEKENELLRKALADAGVKLPDGAGQQK